MSKVAIYARVSTVDKQDYQRQISDCLTAIGDKFSENSIEIFAEQISGYKENEARPQLSKLLSITDNDPTYFSRIYCTELSRLGREPRATRNLLDDLTDKKIPVFITSINRQTLDENGERDSIMNIILQVLMEFADSESKTMKKRSKSGLLQSVVNGNAGGSKNLPYGYAKDEDKKLIIEDEEAEIIKEIFKLYKQGNGFKAIANILNYKEVPTRTQKSYGNQLMKFRTEKTADKVTWNDAVIDKIIKNPLYYGQRRFKGNLYPAPAIISEQLYKECNEITATKTHRNYLTTYTYLLKDLLICGCCGRNYFAKFKPVEGGDKVYICSSRLIKGGNCGNIGINISLLESAIYTEFVSSGRLANYIQMNKVDLFAELKTKIESLESDLKIAQTAFGKKENEKKRLLDLYLDDKVDSAIFEKKQAEINQSELELTIKINLLSEEIFQNKKIFEKQNDKQATIQMLIDAKDNRVELKTLFNQFISRVIINKLDAKTVLASVFINYGGKEIGHPFKLFLNIRGLISRPMKYEYVSVNGMDYRPIYRKNILLNDPSKLLQEVEENKNVYVDGGDTYDFYIINIAPDDLISIENSYPIKTNTLNSTHIYKIPL
ncbi:recombinase family protein [Flavobacterium sp. MC2016-06]|uniref:recombinase family protein n=1 Tax=Flavobacterium sp. MC2016-06 TaxID=2676308 RepID=UPI0012BAE080|nr:recombinase family protein [Flavobacterium sp. MC2016-06]MBU3861020.1 recombinase family protein [Flavobacterium sp. MC2016-06]